MGLKYLVTAVARLSDKKDAYPGIEPMLANVGQILCSKGCFAIWGQMNASWVKIYIARRSPSEQIPVLQLQ